ncbi:MAG: beta-galactosidase [Akkermansiaceae bacterium]|nr:beta-galactosidase [Akkermansiaceae bacterium]
MKLPTFSAAAAAVLLSLAMVPPAAAQAPKRHTFEIGDEAFLLDGKPFVIRTGEMHFTRVPHEYWRHRLQLLKAMGMNAVCAYLFWNFHEFEEGKFDWSGQADAAEFCRIAQEEGLWVVLRPGPYVCSEWDGGGLPWWLLKNPDIHLRSKDPKFMEASRRWFKEVGKQLAPLEVHNGGPILLTQVENEYGSYGNDAQYMGMLRDALVDAGFKGPFFACNPVYDLGKGNRKDIFNVVNFGRDAKGAFEKLRRMQPKGPLMCGEFYPGWFDTWGAPHHFGNIDQNLADLRYMLENNGSFSLYMAHGGTSFGMWPGADRPFKPDTNSYDYDAPISEAGWIGDKFEKTRALMKEFLQEGETLPDPPAQISVTSLPPIRFTKTAGLLENLPQPVPDKAPRHMEKYDQGQGSIVYSTKIPAGPAAELKVGAANDFAWIFLDGKQAGIFDRRSRRFSAKLPARTKPARLDILVHTMGHVNFGKEIHDRKGINGEVTLGGKAIDNTWHVFPLRYDAKQLASLKWQDAGGKTAAPAFWHATFDVETPADTFLDMRSWGKGLIWINGRCLSRFWNIGPTQTAFLPGAWLKEKGNELIVLDLLGPEKPEIAGLETPILNQLRPELDFASGTTIKADLKLDGVAPVMSGSFKPSGDVQEIRLPQPVKGRQFCLETLNAHDGNPYAAVAEFDLSDAKGNPISHQEWTIAYVDSEEHAAEDGSASNAIDGQTANFWHTEWKNNKPDHPHRLVIDLGSETEIGGFRYTPRAGDNVGGRIKDYRIYVGNGLAVPKGE